MQIDLETIVYKILVGMNNNNSDEILKQYFWINELYQVSEANKLSRILGDSSEVTCRSLRQ